MPTRHAPISARPDESPVNDHRRPIPYERNAAPFATRISYMSLLTGTLLALCAAFALASENSTDSSSYNDTYADAHDEAARSRARLRPETSIMPSLSLSMSIIVVSSYHVFDAGYAAPSTIHEYILL